MKYNPTPPLKRFVFQKEGTDGFPVYFGAFGRQMEHVTNNARDARQFGSEQTADEHLAIVNELSKNDWRVVLVYIPRL